MRRMKSRVKIAAQYHNRTVQLKRLLVLLERVLEWDYNKSNSNNMSAFKILELCANFFSQKNAGNSSSSLRECMKHWDSKGILCFHSFCTFVANADLQQYTIHWARYLVFCTIALPFYIVWLRTRQHEQHKPIPFESHILC